MTIDDSTKAALLKLLNSGEITEAEAARLVGVTRQRVQYWTRGIDVVANRERHMAMLLRNAKRAVKS